MFDHTAEPVSSTPAEPDWLIAEGRREATEGWEREWAVVTGGTTWPMDSEDRARRHAERADDYALVSRLVGPWEPAPLRSRCPFCCSADDGRRIEVRAGAYVRHLTGAGGECSGSGKSLAELPPWEPAEQPEPARCPACSRPATSIRDQGDGPTVARKWLPCGCTRIVPVGGDR